MAVARVAARVREGGHNVPEGTIRRRYEAGLHNFFGLYQPMATTWKVCDNSGAPATRLIAAGELEAIRLVADPPTWDCIRTGYTP